MNTTSTNYCLESMSRRSSLCPPSHEDPVLSPPLTPALSQHHPFDKRQSADLAYASSQYARQAYPMDSYQQWMNHNATLQYHQPPQLQHPSPLSQQQLHTSIPTSQVHTSMAMSAPSSQPIQSQKSQRTSSQRSLLATEKPITTGTSTRKQPTKQNKHMCTYPDCLWSFKRFEHLKRHMLVHTGERPHVCPHPGCGKRFSRSDNFHAHYRTHEKKAFAKQKQQQQQQQDTSSSTSTTSSVMTPTNSAPSYLMKDVKEQPANFMHPYYHSNAYPLLPTPSVKSEQHTFMNHGYTQDYMDHSTTADNHASPIKTNKIKEELHQKKPHACTHPDCDRRFRRLEHLKRHMRIHTHEQPFKCNFPGCLKAFSRSDNLTQHRKTHERRGSKYNTTNNYSLQQQHFMHPNTTTPDSFTLVDFVRDNNDHYHAANTSPNPNNTQFHDKHSMLAWQNPGDTTTESVGC